MKNHTTKRRSTRARSLGRLVVWVLLLGMVVGGWELSGMSDAQSALQQERQALHTSTQAFDGAVSGVSATQTLPAVAGLDSALLQGQATGGCKTKDTCLEYLAGAYQGNELQLLPAYRWANPPSLSNTYGSGDHLAGRSVISNIAEIFFAIAGWIWWLLLSIVAVGMRMDPLFSNSIGVRVNTLFYGLSQGISAGFVWFACVGGVLVALMSPLRGRGAPSIISLVIGVAVPLGFLWTMTTAADPAKNAVTVGSPVWLGRQGVNLLDQTTGFAASQMNNALEGVLIDDPLAGNSTQLTPNCSAYTSALHQAFNRSWSTDLALSKKNADNAARDLGTVNGKPVQSATYEFTNVGGNGGAGTLSSLSNLWESSFLPQWIAAEFDGKRPAYRIYCHYMERGAGKPGPEQATIGVIAGYPAVTARTMDAPLKNSFSPYVAPISNRVRPASGAPSSPATTPAASSAATATPYNSAFSGDPALGPYFGSDRTKNTDLEKSGIAKLLMWAACSTDANGNFQPGPAWADEGGVTPAICQTWWATGDNSGWLEWNEESATEMKNQTVCQPPTNGAAGADCVEELGAIIMATHGKNASTRFFAGVLSAVSAVFYFWVLGMVSLGLIIAKIGFILMLMLLPVTLFLLAIPKWRVDPKRAQRNATGLKLMKRTIGFAAASSVFQMLVILIILTIALVRSVLIVLPAGNGIVDVATPLISLFLVKKLMQQSGLGDLTSPSGALGLGAAAAAGIAGGSMRDAKLQAAKNQSTAEKAGKTAKELPGKIKNAAQRSKDTAGNIKDAIANAPQTMMNAADKVASGMEKARDGLAAAAAKAAAAPGAALGAAKGAAGGVKDWAKKMADAAAYSKGALAGMGAGPATALAGGAAAGYLAGKAASDAASAKSAEELAAASSAVASALSSVSAETAAAAAAISSVQNAASTAITKTDVAQSATDMQSAVLAGGRAGQNLSTVLADQRTLQDGAVAVDRAATAISSATGGAISKDAAMAGILNGSMAGFVQQADGSLMGVGEALQKGQIGFDSNGNMVPLAAGVALHKTDGSTPGVAGPGPVAAALADAAAAARVHDPLFSAGGAAAAATATAAALGVASVGAVRGSGGVLVPASTPGGLPAGHAFDLDKLGGSVAAAPLAFNPSTADQILAAVGGDTNAAAAVFAEALALKGCSGANLGTVADHLVDKGGRGAANALTALAVASTPDEANQAWGAFRENYGMSLSAYEISHCVAAAGITAASYQEQELAALRQPVLVAQERAQAALATANDLLSAKHPDVAAVSAALADAHAYSAVAEASQADIDRYCASGGNVRPSGTSSVDVAAVRQAAQVQYTEQFQELGFVGRHTSHTVSTAKGGSTTIPNPDFVAVQTRDVARAAITDLSGTLAGFGGNPPVASPFNGSSVSSPSGTATSRPAARAVAATSRPGRSPVGPRP